jgi:hypothetical protein
MTVYTGSIATIGQRISYQVSLTAGRRYFFELEGSATGAGTLFDPMLRLLSGVSLIASNDDGGVGLNSRLSYVPLTTGTYTVEASELGDNATGTYRLNVDEDDFRSTNEGEGPLGAVALGTAGATGVINYASDQDLFNVSLVAGTRYFIDLEGVPTSQGTLVDPIVLGIYSGGATPIASTADDNGGAGLNARVVFTPTVTGAYQIAAGGVGTQTGSYRLLVRADDYRGNLDSDGPTGVVTPGAAGTVGVINYVGDRDVYQAALVAGTRYYIDMEGTATGQGTIVDTFIPEIRDGLSNTLNLSDDDSGVGNNSRVVFTPTTNGTYTITASGWGAWTGSYRLFVRPDDFKSTFEGAGTSGIAAVGTTGATGTIDYGGDQDLFGVSLVAGRRYFIDLEGAETKQGTLTDPYLRGIYNSAGVLQASTTDDDGGAGLNGRVVFTPTVTGAYQIAAGAVGTRTGSYRMFVRQDDYRGSLDGDGPTGTVAPGAAGMAGVVDYVGDRDVFQVAMVAGTRYYIDMEGSATGQGTIGDAFITEIRDGLSNTLNLSDDDSGVGANARVVFTPTTNGTYTIIAGGWGSWTGSYRLFVRPDDFKSTTEGAGTSGVVAVGTTGATGTIDYSTDQDLFGVSLVAGTQYFVDLEGAPTSQGTLADPYLRGIYNAAGTLQAGTTNDDGGVGLNAGVVFTPATSGTYQIAAGGLSGGTGTYRLLVRADDFRSVLDGTGAAGALALGTTGLTGNVNFIGDRDLFTVSLTAGTRYVIDMEGTPTGQGTIADPYIAAVYAPGGAPVAGLSDDDGGIGNNARVEFTPTVSGDYAISAGGWGAWTGTYRITARADDYKSTFEGVGTVGTITPGGTASGTIETFADQDFFKVTLAANHLYRIAQRGSPTGNGSLGDPYLRGIYNAAGTLLPGSSNDDSGGSRNASVDFFAATAGDYYIAAGAYASHQGTYQLAVTDLTGPDLPATIATTGSLALDGTVRGVIETSSDIDWYRVSLTGGVGYVFEMRSIDDSANPVNDPFIRGIYNASSGLISNTSNDDWGGERDSRVLYTPASSGTYYIAAGAYSNNTGEFNLSLTSNKVTDGVSNTILTTEAITVGGSRTGTIDYARDLDWFRVTLNAGTTYRIREQGSPSGNGTLLDTYFGGVHDADGVLIAGSGNDDADGSRDSRSSFTPSTTGTYYLSAGGYYNNVGTYRLSIEVDTDTSEVPANASSKATVAVGGSYNGSIGNTGDVDWIGFTAVAGTTYQVRLSGSGVAGATLADPVMLGINAPSGLVVPLSGNDDANSGVKYAQTTFTAAQSGTHYVAAAAHAKGVGSYQLAVTKAADIVAPTLLHTSPDDNASAVPVGRNLSLDFNEAVKAGSGNIVITGGGKTLTIAANDATQVTYSGEIVSINPAANLAPNTAYAVTIADGAITDLAGNKFAGIADSTTFNFTTAAASSQDAWTIMVYIAADNNLEGAALDDLNEMESLNLPANVNLVVLVDRAGGYSTGSGNWTDTRRGQITHDANNNSNSGLVTSTLTSLGELNTGSGTTLTNFINWAGTNHPAQHYGLILWDHGGGLAGSAWDDKSNGDNLTILETRQAIEAATIDHFAMIGFDECLMAITEQTLDLRNLTDMVVSSQEVEPGDGWEYQNFLAPFQTNPNLSPMDLGASIVSSYGTRYAGDGGITLSAVWTDGVAALDTALEAFTAQALLPATTAADWTAMREAAARAHEFSADDHLDLRDFMNEVVNRALSPDLRTAAGNVSTAITNAVIANTGTVGDASGIGIYLPYGSTPVQANYTPANYGFLNQVVNWDNFLQQL